MYGIHKISYVIYPFVCLFDLDKKIRILVCKKCISAEKIIYFNINNNYDESDYDE